METEVFAQNTPKATYLIPHRIESATEFFNFFSWIRRATGGKVPGKYRFSPITFPGGLSLHQTTNHAWDL